MSKPAPLLPYRPFNKRISYPWSRTLKPFNNVRNATNKGSVPFLARAEEFGDSPSRFQVALELVRQSQDDRQMAARHSSSINDPADRRVVNPEVRADLGQRVAILDVRGANRSLSARLGAGRLLVQQLRQRCPVCEPLYARDFA